MTRLEAIEKMRTEARSIFKVSAAAEIGAAFTLTLDDLPIRDFQNGQERALIHTPGAGVGINALSIAIVEHLGGEPVRYGAYIGTGKNAEFVTLENCKILEKMGQV